MNASQPLERQPCFRTRFDFSQVLGARKLVSASVGPRGEAVLLAVLPEYEKEPFGKEQRKGFAIFPLSKARRRYPAAYIWIDEHGAHETQLTQVESAFPYVQPLPGGEILIVGARCNFRNGDPEQNAAVFSNAGVLKRQFVLGDGINGVLTSTNGQIWVSYFDEGVFGNFGWDKPIGASGLVCFDPTGRIVWEFRPPDGTDTIADCYAFNVCEDSVWTYYYTEFSLVRIDANFQVRAWKNTVTGARVIAVSPSRVLLWGGYGEKRARCVMQTLQSNSVVNPVELCLSIPAGLDGATATFIGRGSVLHAFSNNRWFTLDISGCTSADCS